MKPRIQWAALTGLALLYAVLLMANSTTALAQGGVGRGAVSAPRDPELEKQSAHNLDVARYYFKRKPGDKKDKDGWARLNKAVIDRLQEIIDTNPNFARLDSVYFLLGDVYTRDNQTDKALECWSIIVKDYPDSEHLPEAKKRLGSTVEVDKKTPATKETKPEKKG
jgi:tetratricopeptide (TPR) repeat protein